jgi:hypothetical protein
MDNSSIFTLISSKVTHPGLPRRSNLACGEHQKCGGLFFPMFSGNKHIFLVGSSIKQCDQIGVVA